MRGYGNYLWVNQYLCAFITKKEMVFCYINCTKNHLHYTLFLLLFTTETLVYKCIMHYRYK